MAAAKRPVGVKEKLEVEFAKPEYENLVEHNVEVHLPEIRNRLSIPYGYQNYRYHLIQPVQFQRENAAEVVARAGRYRFESELLSGVQQRLVVVAEFPTGDTNTPSIVEKLLKEKNAEFYRIEEVEELLSVIRATAKPISSSDAF